METLTKKERYYNDIRFYSDTIQGGRIKPASFIHELEMPHDIFEEMRERKLIDIAYLTRRERNTKGKISDPIAFFEFKSECITISFQHIYNREDFRTMADRYLIVKAYGSYPYKANWVSKLNFDKKVELVITKNEGKKK